MNQVLIKVIGNYQYQATHCLGEGVYGKVYQGIQRQTKEKVAIKKIDLSSLKDDKYLENAIFSEIYLLKRFDHPNVVKFKDVLSSKNSLYIITEFCKGGDLKDMIKKKRFTQDEAFQVIRQISNGFNELVAKKVVHRDLKPANILIHEGVYKIADFGFAKYVDNFGSQMLKSCVGSPIYMAPQLLERQNYTTKCDVWSLGVMTYQMLFGLSPWRAKDENQLIHGLKTIPITNIIKHQKNLSAKMFQFIAKCLAYYEKDRYSWNQIFNLFLPVQQLHSLSMSPQTSSNNTNSPTRPSSHVRMYNPKTRTTQPFQQLNSTAATNNHKQKQKIETNNTPSSTKINEQLSKSPRLDYYNYTSPINKSEKTDKLETLLNNKTQIPQIYTPRQHTQNMSLNIPAPTYTPRQNVNSSAFYFPQNLQIPSSPVSTPNIVISPRPLSNNSPTKKSSSNIESNRQQYNRHRQQRIHNICQYRYFCCTQLYLEYMQIEYLLIDSYPLKKMLYILIQLTKFQNNFVKSELFVAPYSKPIQILLTKIQSQQKLIQALQKSICSLLQTSHCLYQCQDQMKSYLNYLLTQLMSEQKLHKMSQLLYQSIRQNISQLLNLKNKDRYSNFQNEQNFTNILWILTDLLSIHKNTNNSLMDVSQRDQQQRKQNGISLEFRLQRLTM